MQLILFPGKHIQPLLCSACQGCLIPLHISKNLDETCQDTDELKRAQLWGSLLCIAWKCNVQRHRSALKMEQWLGLLLQLHGQSTSTASTRNAYADTDTFVTSCTGNGEAILRLLSHDTRVPIGMWIVSSNFAGAGLILSINY